MRQEEKDVKLEKQATLGSLNATASLTYKGTVREDPNSRTPTLLTKVGSPSTMAFSHALHQAHPAVSCMAPDSFLLSLATF